MKLLKVLTIVLFSLSLCFSALSAQENGAADTQKENLQQDSNSGTGIEKTVPAEKTETVKILPETANTKKASVIENKSESRKNISKKSVEKKADKKAVTVSVEVKEENSNQVTTEGDLLPINEGNFKYKRIPDIKLIEIKPEAAETNIQVAEVPKSGQNTSTGFLGLSKTASDVIVKGGALLLLLLIFILYKSRMSRPGNKISKKRNVLNSYRK